MNFQKIVRSKGFWVIAGASVLIAVAVWALARTAGTPWALGVSAGALGLLLGGVYTELRMALSSASSGLAGLRKLAFDNRNKAQDRDFDLRDVLTEAMDGVQKSNSEVIEALDQTRGLNAEAASRNRADVAQIRDLANQQFLTLDQRSQKMGAQLQDALKQLNKMNDEIERIVATTDRTNSGSLAADVHRTLRGTRALERSMAEANTLEHVISHTFKHELGNFERLREEIAVQRRILSELLLAVDFKP